jgi:hypothetical protein
MKTLKKNRKNSPLEIHEAGCESTSANNFLRLRSKTVGAYDHVMNEIEQITR